MNVYRRSEDLLSLYVDKFFKKVVIDTYKIYIFFCLLLHCDDSSLSISIKPCERRKRKKGERKIQGLYFYVDF